MGIYYDSSLIYGLEYKEAVNVIADLDDMIDYGEIDCASPHYDSAREEWFVGVEIGNYHDTPESLLQATMKAVNTWNKISGSTEGYIRCCCDIS